MQIINKDIFTQIILLYVGKLFIVNTLYPNKKLHLGVPQWNCRSNLLSFSYLRHFIVYTLYIPGFYCNTLTKTVSETQTELFLKCLIYFFHLDNGFNLQWFKKKNWYINWRWGYLETAPYTSIHLFHDSSNTFQHYHLFDVVLHLTNINIIILAWTNSFLG